LYNEWRKSVGQGSGLLNRGGAKARISSWKTKLVIPPKPKSLDEFVKDLAVLLASRKTHIYVDTSFLVWLTALGKEARAEFFDWTKRSASQHIHVPVWSAHEYFRHHVTDLHGTKLSKIAHDLRNIADESFKVLRPYLDCDVAGDPRPPATIMTAARSSLIEIKEIATIAGKWRDRHYDANAREVIAFINRVGLDNPALLEWMDDIEALESARFEGRIPPGFQDRGKSANGDIGSNRYGDLVFWKEILEHARGKGATGVIVLTNDLKNDWTMGGDDQPKVDDELRSLWNDRGPIPRPHPMLQFEARNLAGVTDLMLVDRSYLAIYLRRTGESSERFFGAAIDVAVPKPEEAKRAQRAELRRSVNPRKSAPKPAAEAPKGASVHLPTEDGPNVADSPVALKIALTASGRAEDPKMRPVLNAMLSPEAEGKGLFEFLTRDALKSWDTAGIVWFVRSLGEKSAAGDMLASAYASDLLSFLDRLPPRTAAALYLGLLAAAYFDGENLRPIPLGSWLTQLFRLQSNPHASAAIAAFRAHAAKLSGGPVYMPDVTMPAIPVKPVLGPARDGLPRLTGLQIGGIGVLFDPEVEEERRLANRFLERSSVTVREVVSEACVMLGIPGEQIAPADILDREVRFSSSVGVAGPADLQNGMDEQS
jgi:hypothetical protein